MCNASQPAFGGTCDHAVVDEGRERAVELVELLMDAAGLDDAQVDAAMEELESLVPDPNVSDLIFWPQHHGASRGLTQDELTAERIVEVAMSYRPFAP